MTKALRQSEIELYLDEALPPERMAEIERALRDDPALIHRATEIHSRRGAGVHSLGEIWRGARLSCPAREQLGSYLLGALSDEVADYVAFHLDVVGCRLCRANLIDLERLEAERGEDVQTRRRRYFQSSAGYLRRGQ